jgi:hypothetical protein
MGNSNSSEISYDEIIRELLNSSEFLGLIVDDVIDDDLAEVRADIKDRRTKLMSNRRAAPRTRNRAYALEEMHALSDTQFQRMFRLNRTAFNFLLAKIEPDIQPKPSLNHIFHHSSKEINSKHVNNAGQIISCCVRRLHLHRRDLIMQLLSHSCIKVLFALFD